MKNIYTSIQKLQNALELEIHVRNETLATAGQNWISTYEGFKCSETNMQLQNMLDDVVTWKKQLMNV